MDKSENPLLKEQYESLPYPQIPIEKSPQDNYTLLANRSLTVPYYLAHKKVIGSQDKVILDVGCGSGWTSLQLACANPGAKIVCIDLSPKSLDFAKKRLNHHGFENVEIYPMMVEDIGSLGYKFDYINCDDILCLVDNPTGVLEALKSVLKPDGIIHGNFHSFYQRFQIYNAQKLFTCLGLLEDNPGDFEVEMVADTIKNLNNNTILKKYHGDTFENPNFDPSDDKYKQYVLMNYLLQGDKGYTIPDVFGMLRESGLNFLSMVNWLQWNVEDLFKGKDKIPTAWEFVLANASEEEKYHLFELLHPCHRLIDFWCTHDGIDSSFEPLSDYKKEDWSGFKIHLHPIIRCEKIKDSLLEAITKHRPWNITEFIKVGNVNKYFDMPLSSNLGAVLLLLWEESLSFDDLVSHWLRIQPINLVTSEDKTRMEAEEEIKELIIQWEVFLFLLVEK